MADNILRLRVQSDEYDAKLKKAAEGIRHLAEVAHKGGGELTGLEKAELDYIKSLGTMETKSRTAAGSVRELENTFKELTVVYNNLNEVEKNDEGGKALRASLDQLKQRAQEAKAQLDTASKSLTDNGQSAQQSGGILEALAGKFTLNIDALKLFDMGLSATKVALDVAKDAFFASEANVDEWGRTVAASQSLYEGFLTAINNGDISGYLSNIDSIVKAARLAYDELDKLGTMKTIQAPQISKQQTENERIRMMIQTGRYIAPQDGRVNTIFNGRVMQNGDKLTAGQIRAMEKQLQSGMQNVTALVGNEVKQTGKAIDAYYNKIAKTNGMTLQEFKKGTSSWEEFSKKMEGYDQYKEWDKQARAEFAKQGGRGFVDFDKNNPYAEFKKWGTFRVDKDGDNSYKDLVGLIQQRDQQIGQMYSTQAQAYRTMNRAEGVTVRKIMGDSGGGKGGKTTKEEIKYADDSIMAQEKLISDLTQKWKTASGELRDGYLKQLDEAKAKLKEMTAVDNLPTFTMAELEGTRPKSIDLRGNEGKAQDKLDLATAAFATSGTSNVDFSNYTAALQNAIKDANIGSELYNQLSEQLRDTTTVSTLLQELMERGMAGADLESTAQALKDKLLSPEGIDQEAVQAWLEELNKQIEEAGGVGLKLNTETGEVGDNNKKSENDLTTAINKATIGVNALSSINSGLKGMGIDLGDDIGNAISFIQSMMTVVQGVQAIISLFQTPAIATNTFALNTLTATLIAKSFLPGLANGGIVPAFAQGGLIGRAAAGMMIPGNSMSGDRLRLPVDGGRGMVGVNSGELILNRAQQGIIAQELEGGSFDNVQLEARVSAEDIIFILNNNANRRGYSPFIND